MNAFDPRSTTATRIGLCITELDPGGAERALVELATRLDRRKFEPVVYCLGPRPAGNPASLADHLEQAGVVVHCFNARRIGQSLGVLRSLRNQLREDAPALLQCFLFHANLLGSLAARGANVPHVLTGIRVAEEAQAWHLKLARAADRLVQCHVCVSEAVRDFSRQSGRLPSEKLLVIPNGVDVERFATARPVSLATLGLPAGRRAIAAVGRLEPQKGFEELLACLPQLFAQLPEHDLVVVGQGPLRESLAQSARALHVAERVHLVGFRDDVPAVLAASDLLILPSRWEGMPNIVLEAMAAGKPVVANAVAGVSELLGETRDLQMAPLNQPETLIAKAVRILSNTQVADDLGRQNQARVREYFSIERTVRAYEQLYERILTTSRAR